MSNAFPLHLSFLAAHVRPSRPAVSIIFILGSDLVISFIIYKLGASTGQKIPLRRDFWA